MDITTATQLLETEWDTVQDNGFFGELRSGNFDAAKFKRVRDILSSVNIPTDELIDRRFIEVIWFIPTFMRWQQDGWRIEGKNTQFLDEAIAFVEQRLTTILGLP